ncbi:psp operon transcriptional activator [Vibrio cholerae]|nr:psp operon transcriptional activator [Vibrio cholerae]
MLQAALTQAKFNQKHAAQLLGLSYHQFRGMMRKYPQMNSENASPHVE